MAKRMGPVAAQSDGMDEGYPRPSTNDGVNTKKIAGREGFQRQLGRPLNQHTDWHNSKTGACCDAPEYANDDWD